MLTVSILNNRDYVLSNTKILCKECSNFKDMLTSSNIFLLEHVRSGGNYLAALISVNIFGEKWITFNSTHGFIDPIDSFYKYIWLMRNKEDTLKSVYSLHKMFSLKVSSYEEFVDTPYRDMYIEDNKDLHDVREYRGLIEKQVIMKGKRFKDINISPSKYYDYYYRYYTEKLLEGCNVHTVRYENLISDFYNEMTKLSTFLGVKRTIFYNVKRKMGYYIHKDNEYESIVAD